MKIVGKYLAIGGPMLALVPRFLWRNGFTSETLHWGIFAGVIGLGLQCIAHFMQDAYKGLNFTGKAMAFAGFPIIWWYGSHRIGESASLYLGIIVVFSGVLLIYVGQPNEARKSNELLLLFDKIVGNIAGVAQQSGGEQTRKTIGIVMTVIGGIALIWGVVLASSIQHQIMSSMGQSNGAVPLMFIGGGLLLIGGLYLLLTNDGPISKQDFNKNESSVHSPKFEHDIEKRIRVLGDLRDKNLITPEEYEQRRRQIIETL